MILSEGPVPEIEPHDVPQAPEVSDAEECSAIISLHVARTGWRIRGRGGAADQLGLKPTTLESRMSKLGIHRHPRASHTVAVA
jgi:transcriptional regulator with GAF, ATPase, and Fis domain